MTDKSTAPVQVPDSICGNCGYASQAHYLANYADGPHVSVTLLICPTAVFALQERMGFKPVQKP